MVGKQDNEEIVSEIEGTNCESGYRLIDSNGNLVIDALSDWSKTNEVTGLNKLIDFLTISNAFILSNFHILKRSVMPHKQHTVILYFTLTALGPRCLL